MATIHGTKFNDNGIDKPKLIGTDPILIEVPNSPPLLIQSGADTIYGKAGNDILSGLGDNDQLYGGTGNDQLYGGTGNDQLYGDGLWGTGNDYLWGDAGNDNLYGRSGDDYLDGGTGNDKLYGGSGDDDLWGEAGNDILTGGIGKDYLNGFSNGTEFDTLSGGADADKFVLGAQNYYNFYTGEGFALITDFNSSQGDKIALFETVGKYSLVSGNFGYGNPNVQDTKILFGNDEIGVLQDITNVKATDFILGDPFPG
jgi:Ca2+-binding RTX toxin-like protein